MTDNEKLLARFYTAFANANPDEMCACYHPDIKFSDPVFNSLKGQEVCQMWTMLLKKSKGNIKIHYSEVKANQFIGSAKWIANYQFSKTKRMVTNTIYAQFQFKDGLIIKHTDNFDIWKWSKQAFGLKGFLFGWTGFMQKKIQEQAMISFKKHQQAN
jgi:hypothetical protein